MNVTELVDLISQFTFSELPTKKQREVYLRCLNLCNLELYQRILNSNQFFQSKDLPINESGEFIIDSDIFYLKKIYNKKKTLKPYDIKDAELYLSKDEYFRLGNELIVGSDDIQTKDFEGNNKKYLEVIYVPYPKKLVEEVSYGDDTIDTPIFAEPFHYTLVVGSVYHVLVSTKGYNEKINMQFQIYQQSLSKFDNYYNIK